MSLSRNSAMVAASIAVAVVVAPASAQTLDKAAAAAAPKAAANLAAPTSGVMPQSSAPVAVRSTSKVKAAGGESGSGKAPTAANDAK